MGQARSNNDTPPSLRVLHVASGDLWAGAEVQIVHLLRALDSQCDLELRVVLMNEGIMAEKLREAGIPVDVLDEGRRGATTLWNGLRAVIRAWRPGVVHTHRRKEHILGASAAWGTGARLFATCHGRSEQLSSRPRLRDRTLATLQWAVLGHCHDRVVAVSDELAGHIPLPTEHIEVICNGIDPDETRRAIANDGASLPGDSPVKFAFIGRLVPVKQLDRLLLTMNRLERAMPGRFSLYVVGDGPLRSQLEDLARELGLAEMVHFLGFQPHPLPIIATMDAVLFSSKHEGLPMTALEALALGVPVVAPPVGGLIDLLSQSPLGILAASDEPEALAEAILGAHTIKPKQVPGIPGVPEKYLLSTSAQKYRDLYDSLADPGKISTE